MARKNENSADKEINQTGVSSDDRVEKLVHTIVEKLKRGKGLEAMSLFAEGQMRHILSSTPNLPKRLVELMGKEMTDKLIGVFVHSPCPFCKKGRVTCENCDGHGHIDHEMACTDCLSLGLVKCDFCDGSGWSTIDSIPAGLRALVLYQRTKVAKARIKKILVRGVPNVARYKPVIILKKCAQLLTDLNRYIGVLENTVTGKDELVKSRYWSRVKIKKIVISCIQTAIDAERKAREIVKHMAEIARTQAEKPDEDSDAQKLAAVRAEFYESLLDSSNIFEGTNLEHPFLDETTKKLSSRRADTKKDDQIIL
ncbi:MAG: hypothetical protein WBC22_18625 [Sedimentisphaerales bacterium]